MNITPTLYENALSDAELAAGDIIADKLGMIVGNDFFIGFNPGVPEAAVSEIGAIRNPDCVHNNASHVFHFGGILTLYGRERRGVQALVMRVIKASPFTDEDVANTNVLQLMVSGEGRCVSEVKIKEITPVGEHDAIEVYTVEVDLDVVFDCGERL